MRKRSIKLIFALMLVPVAVAAQATNQNFSVIAGHLYASIGVSDPPAQRIIGSLRDGLESEVQYEVRVYQPASGFLGLLGDRLVGEYHETYVARWDEFSGNFIVNADSRAVGKAVSAQSFLAHLFHLSNVDTGILLAPGTYYLLSAVRIQIVKLVPPLTMIAPFLSQRQIETHWIRTEVKVP